MGSSEMTQIGIQRMRGRAARAVGIITLATLGVAGTGLIAGCSGPNGSSAGASSAGRAAAGSLPDSGSAGSGAAGGSGSSGSTTSTDVADTVDRIITAGLQLGTRNPEQAAAHAEQVTTSAGGYVAAEEEGPGPQALPVANKMADSAEAGDTGVSPMTLPTPVTAPNSDQALLLLRVPPSKLESVLAALKGTGDTEYSTESATDVTGQVADVNSRIASAQASLTELRGMIDKAASMNDLISLEQALASRESDLESLEAQQRALSDQIQYATVTVGYYQPAAATASPKPAAHHNGFVTALDDGWHALVAAVRAVLIVVGWLLPFAIVVALLWWPVRRVLRLIGGTRASGTRTWSRWRAGHPTE